MFRSHAAIAGLPFVTRYGFGWLIGEFHDRPLYVHAGDNPGYMALNALLPTADARVVLLSNDESTDVYTTAIGCLEAVVA
jgi:hypothetical protein